MLTNNQGEPADSVRRCGLECRQANRVGKCLVSHAALKPREIRLFRLRGEGRETDGPALRQRQNSLPLPLTAEE
jgi:hypothetical protein